LIIQLVLFPAKDPPQLLTSPNWDAFVPVIVIEVILTVAVPLFVITIGRTFEVLTVWLPNGSGLGEKVRLPATPVPEREIV
jgi:hypothetical protein